MRILTGFRKEKDGVWNAGQVYNTNDGRTYDSTISLKDDGSLNVRGFVGFSLFGKTGEWVRPREQLERCA